MISIDEGRASSYDVAGLIRKALPDQGCIEVQRDVPGKEHAWHTHEVDETIIILDGGLRFYWHGGERLCRPGDVIALAAGTPHGSVALAAGATYLIAFHTVHI
jgi:mannose-6-phosphate isomerase-like protein (cupin superfamily)